MITGGKLRGWFALLRLFALIRQPHWEICYVHSAPSKNFPLDRGIGFFGNRSLAQCMLRFFERDEDIPTATARFQQSLLGSVGFHSPTQRHHWHRCASVE
jgi:hypothetical protein